MINMTEIHSLENKPDSEMMMRNIVKTSKTVNF